MSDKKSQNEKACPNCGDERIILTEEMNAVARCAGCQRPRGDNNNTKD